MKKTNHTRRAALLRLLALCLAAAMLLTMLAGCKQEGKPSAAQTSDQTNPAPATDSAAPTTAAPTTAAPTENPTSEAPTEATEPTLNPADLDPTIDYEGLNTLDTYTASELAADDPRMDKAIASCAGSELTNRQLQIYYYLQVFSYISQIGQYGASPIMIGLDFTKPLSEQNCMEVPDLSWEKFFLMLALDQFHVSAALNEEAERANYSMDETLLQQLRQNLDALKEEAANRDYAALDDFLADSFGIAVKEADYSEYMNFYYHVMSFEQKFYQDLNCSDEDLLAYFTAHPEDYPGITTDQKNINVRHILIMPEDADDDKQSTDEEWAAAKAKAEALLAEYLKNPTEDNFSALAKQNSQDPGSQSNGGLYEEVYPGQMVQTFNDWCFDAARKPGDTGIVETTYGYHVMYFVKQTDNYYWKTIAKDDYLNSRMQTWLTELTDGAKMNVDYASIVLNPVPNSLQHEAE